MSYLHVFTLIYIKFEQPSRRPIGHFVQILLELYAVVIACNHRVELCIISILLNIAVYNLNERQKNNPALKTKVHLFCNVSYFI